MDAKTRELIEKIGTFEEKATPSEELKFCCESKRTHSESAEMLKEISAKVFLLSRSNAIISLILVAGLVFMSVLSINGKLDPDRIIIMIVAIIIYIAATIFKYLISTKKMIKTAQNLPEEIEERDGFTESYHETLLSNGSYVRFRYENMRTFVVTSNCIMFLYGGVYSIVKKDAFVKGTPDELIAFLSSKGIKEFK